MLLRTLLKWPAMTPDHTESAMQMNNDTYNKSSVWHFPVFHAVRVYAVLSLCIFTCFFMLVVCSDTYAQSESKITPEKHDGNKDFKPAKTITDEGLFKKISKAKGKILVVNFWATWCPPCVKEFPYFIKLFDTYNNKEVVLISVSVDHPDTIPDRVLPFLKKHKVPFTVDVLKSESPGDLMKKFSPEWAGGVPATFVYDDKGNLKRTWFEEVTYEELIEVVDPLLKKKIN